MWIDFKKLVLWLTPTWLRFVNVMLLQKAWNLPIRQHHDTFQTFVANKKYRLEHNSQTCYLRAALNDAFDLVQRRILVVDFDGLDKLYFWPETDDRDYNFGDEVFYFWPDNAYGDSGVDFTVKIPVDVATVDHEMKRLIANINEYKLPGKNYNIVRI